ncbi:MULTISPECIES: hypothetical protein [Streptomyces]|uniref:Uncharacterized protein n=1 Tax=Streptomyces luteosporeus TaxID=173856 RepID=A0ABN3TJF2_9ACTN
MAAVEGKFTMKAAYRRAMTTLAATLLLCGLGAALAAPAEADVDANVAGGLATAHGNETVEASALGVQLVNSRNPLPDVL